MSRIAIIVVAALALGAILFTAVKPAAVETEVAEASAQAVELAEAAERQMRLCLGPARVTLGGEPFVGLAFGGDGCDHNAADLVGFRILREPTTPTAVLGSLLPRF